MSEMKTPIHDPVQISEELFQSLQTNRFEFKVSLGLRWPAFEQPVDQEIIQIIATLIQ